MIMRMTCLSGLLVFTVLAASPSAQITRLKLGRTVQDDISQGRSRVYSIKLKRHQYLRADVIQPNPAVMIEMYTPDGKKALELDTRNLINKPSRIVWIAEAGGEYRISVSGAGHYEIKLQELRKARPDDPKRVEAELLFTQGFSEASKYAYDQAILSFTRALGLYHEVHDREREGDALTATGSAHNSVGQYEKAIGYYEQALSIRREAKDGQGEGLTLSGLGDAYYNLSQYEKAISYYRQALAISRDGKARRNEGSALLGLGNAHDLLGQYDKARDYYEQALAIVREVKDRLMEGRALRNLGIVYKHLSQYENAITYYEQALAVTGELKDRRGEGGSLTNLGNAYRLLGQYEKAIGYNEQALAIARDIKDRPMEGGNLIDVGLSYSALSQYEKAIGYYEQALAVHREIKDRDDEGETLAILGEAYYSLNQYERAIGFSEQALVIFREIKARTSEGEVLNTLGETCYKLSQYEKATTFYDQALAISREVKDRGGEASELSGLMDAWQAAGRPRLAIFYGKQAVNIVQSIRSDIRGLGQDLQQSFLKGNEKPYHTLAELLIAQGRLAEAEQVLALLKEEEYFQYIRRDAGEASSLNRRADLTPDETGYEQRYREIGDRLMTIGAERGELLAKKTLTSEQSQRLGKLEQDLAVGNQAFEHFLGELTQHFSAKPELNAKVVEQLREDEGFMEDLRELPAGTVAIYTLAGEDKFHAILRTPDAQKAYEYPIKAADLNRKVFEFREAVGDPRIEPRPQAQELYQILIAPMAEDLRQAKAQTLMWSLDGALRYVPIAALYDGQQYLIEQYRVSVMTLASNARLKDRPDSAWSAAGFGVTKKHEDSEALPEVAAELAGVEEILHGEIKLDDQFTEASMRAALLKRFPVVHIASHFRFQPGDQSKSFLLLGDGGHLSLAELKTLPNLFSGVQLLTLSACNTGVGDGSEVEGFGTLAQRQGAKAVVASLWPVVDESTSLLMREFYRIRQSSPGMTKLEALRESQLRLLRGEVQITPGVERDRGVVSKTLHAGAASFPLSPNAPYAHPFYWAPFFLMGNWL
jgi:CHAT domain-containing protein/tetratricopeptide (TPR) repeat protein